MAGVAAMWANFMQFVLSQVLLAFTLDFERESAVSLAIAANALRVLTAGGIRIRELPYLTGVSKEALSMAAGILTRRSCAVTGPDPAASRGKVIRLTPRGQSAQDEYLRQTTAVLNDPGAALPHYPMVLHRGGWPDGS